MTTINFDSEKIKRLEKAYAKAVKNSMESFIFEGNEYYTDYAKYMLEYLHSRQKNS